MSRRRKVNLRAGMARHVNRILKQANEFEKSAGPGLANKLANKYKHHMYRTVNANHSCQIKPNKSNRLHSVHKNAWSSHALQPKIETIGITDIDNSYGSNVLQKALSKFRSRGIVLLMEQEIGRFVSYCLNKGIDGEYVLLFPECNSYYRLLIHTIAERFGCTTKSFGNSDNKTIIMYCIVDKNDNLVLIPERLKDICCFIPALQLSDLFVHGKSEKYLNLLNESKLYEIELLKPNASNKWSDIILCKVDIDIDGLSNNIVCDNAEFVHYDWQKIFNSNVKQEINDIDLKDIGCHHILEIECKGISNYKLMNFCVSFITSYFENEKNKSFKVKEIDGDHRLIILNNIKEKELMYVLNKFESKYSIYKDMLKINNMKNVSDITKYFSGFTCAVMNKTRGIRDNTVVKRMIDNTLNQKN
eukprot:273314_1